LATALLKITSFEKMHSAHFFNEAALGAIVGHSKFVQLDA